MNTLEIMKIQEFIEKCMKIDKIHCTFAGDVSHQISCIIYVLLQLFTIASEVFSHEMLYDKENK